MEHQNYNIDMIRPERNYSTSSILDFQVDNLNCWTKNPRDRIGNRMDYERLCWLGFSHVPGIGPVKLAQLETYFKDISSAWQANPDELKLCGIENSTVDSIVKVRNSINLELESENLIRLGIRFLTWHDAEYPRRLKEIHDRPPYIFIKGEIKSPDNTCIAVVGTRRPTVYGRQVAEELAANLARNRITIVSGLARGIDTVGHMAALESGGRTVAVLGGSITNIYPFENTNLAGRICENGALITEYPPGTRPRPEYFPRRNRIIAGLSLGTLVIEAGENSGALITARLALEQNREVFSVPGSILSEGSKGTNRLIQEGAKLVTSFSDILEELNLKTVALQHESGETIPATESELTLLKYIGREPRHIDEICEQSAMPAGIVSSTLAMMELKGMIKQIGAMNYTLVREAREKYIIMVE
jgi:DNA processing protein